MDYKRIKYWKTRRPNGTETISEITTNDPVRPGRKIRPGKWIKVWYDVWPLIEDWEFFKNSARGKRLQENYFKLHSGENVQAIH